MGRRVRPVYFNDQAEADLLEFTYSLANFSDWVKKKIRGEFQARETGISPEIAALVERLLEAKLAGRVMVADQGKGEEKVDVTGDVEQFF